MCNELLHVVPVDDLRDHSTDVRKPCWCNPEHDEENNLVVHNSMDGREKFETGERKMS